MENQQEKKPKSTIDQAIESVANLKSFFRLALSRMQNLSRSNIEAGVMQLRRGEFFDAALRFRFAVYMDKNNAVAHYLLGKALTYNKKYDKAAKSLKTALKLQPQMVEAKFLLAVCGYKTDIAQIPRSFIIDRNDILAETYHDFFEPSVSASLKQTLQKEFKEYFDQWQGFGVVDIGCRGGEMGELLRQKANLIVGIEPSIKMSALAKGRRLGTELVYNKVASRFAEDFFTQSEETFQVMLCTYYLDNFGKVDEFFKTVISRMNAAGGVFVFNICLSNGADYEFVPANMMFTHSEKYIDSVLAELGLEVVKKVPLKTEKSTDLIYFTERKAA